jgi:simple sugar transport system permease protein
MDLFRRNSEIIVLILVLVGALVMMLVLNGPSFFKIGNIQSMAFQLPELGILSLAMMITMLTSGINLSIIASTNLSGIVMALILTGMAPTDGGSVFGVVLLALLAGLAVSAVIGLLNGYLIAYLDISPILATLGTMILVNGLAIVLTKGYVISGFPKEMLFIGNGLILGIPVPLLVFLISATIMAVVLEQTPLGTRIYLFGSNPTATFYSGVNNKAVLMRVYLISGLLTSIAAMIMIARFNSAKADYGESYLLLTILAAVLGGVSAAGGFGRVSGLVVALVILQIISSGLNLFGVSAFLTVALWGAVLIFVMVIKYLIEQRSIRMASR